MLISFVLFIVMHRNHRNSTVPTPQIGNSTKQVNKVKPNVNRAPSDNVVSPGYNSRYNFTHKMIRGDKLSCVVSETSGAVLFV